MIDLSRINPKQRQFFKAKARHVAYGGSRGGGKSWAMRTLFVLLALKYDGLKLLLVRRTLPELRENHLLPLMSMLYGVARYSAEEKAFHFPNGSRLRLGYCDSENDVYQYQGQEYDVVGFEEATLFTEFMIQFILTCNRTTRKDFAPRAYYTMNPGGVSHAYFKRLFIDRQFRGDENPDDYLFIQAKVYDNPCINPEYVRTLQNLPEELRKAHLDGDWNVFLGQVFSEWRRDVHVCDPFEIPQGWIRFRAMDWGFAKPYSIHWYAVDYDGMIYCYRELYGIKDDMPDVGTCEDPSEVAKKVRELEKGEDIAYGVADPACWQEDERIKWANNARTVIDAFASEGVYWNKANNARISGKMEVHMRLRGHGKDRPGIRFFSTCKHMIRTLPALQYDKNVVEDVDTKQEDHAYDELRYALKSQPWKPEPEKPKPVDDYGKRRQRQSTTAWSA